MKSVGGWFDEVTEKVDDYSKSVIRKLNELHMSLQRPKIPIIGLGPGVMNKPYHRNLIG